MTSLSEALGPELLARIKEMPLETRMRMRAAVKAKMAEIGSNTRKHSRHMREVRAMVVLMLESGLNDTPPTKSGRDE